MYFKTFYGKKGNLLFTNSFLKHKFFFLFFSKIQENYYVLEKNAIFGESKKWRNQWMSFHLYQNFLFADEELNGTGIVDLKQPNPIEKKSQAHNSFLVLVNGKKRIFAK